jgi:hypothetical protein
MARTELGPFPPGEAVLQAMSASQGAEILEWFKSSKSLTSLSAAVKPRCKAFSRNILYKDHLAVASNAVCQRLSVIGGVPSGKHRSLCWYCRGSSGSKRVENCAISSTTMILLKCNSNVTAGTRGFASYRSTQRRISLPSC